MSYYSGFLENPFFRRMSEYINPAESTVDKTKRAIEKKTGKVMPPVDASIIESTEMAIAQEKSPPNAEERRANRAAKDKAHAEWAVERGYSEGTKSPVGKAAEASLAGGNSKNSYYTNLDGEIQKYRSMAKNPERVAGEQSTPAQKASKYRDHANDMTKIKEFLANNPLESFMHKKGNGEYNKLLNRSGMGSGHTLGHEFGPFKRRLDGFF